MLSLDIHVLLLYNFTLKLVLDLIDIAVISSSIHLYIPNYSLVSHLGTFTSYLHHINSFK